MDMEFETILTGISGFILGGGLLHIITLRSQKRKVGVEVKVDEIQALHDTIDKVYEPIINHLNERVQELEEEVKTLRTQLINERQDHQKEIDMMNRQILEITRALGIKATTQIRDEKGRFTKAENPNAEL